MDIVIGILTLEIKISDFSDGNIKYKKNGNNKNVFICSYLSSVNRWGNTYNFLRLGSKERNYYTVSIWMSCNTGIIIGHVTTCTCSSWEVFPICFTF